MRILQLAPYPVVPADHGGKIRVWNLARRLHARGHDVEVWCISDERASVAGGDTSGVRIRNLPERPRRSTADKLAAATSPLPTAAWVLRSDEALAAMRRARDFDVIVVEQAVCGALVPEIRRAARAWVFDAHNVEWWLTQQVARRLANPITRARFALDAMKFKRLERGLLSDATAVVAVSDRDAKQLHELAPEKTITVHANGVDTDYFDFVDHSTPKGAALVMTGTLGYYPNLDASLWLINEILPLVRGRVPEATLTLAGGHATPELMRLDSAASGVTVAGAVPDVRPYMAAADVFVMPLRLGSGTRLKALEALASGLPLVSTRQGVEGLGLEDRGLVLLGESADELADAVVRAIRDAPLRRRMVTDGRAYAVECAGWDRIAAGFEATLMGAAGG